ncbi:MAG: hypothetical protein KDB88_08560, partial [Flavobacteriales bacterium]|nr:hypothetical protein [Flavobacteriales bacterium]
MHRRPFSMQPVPYLVLPLLIAPSSLAAQLHYQLDSSILAIEVVLDTNEVDLPWEIIWAPDDRLWMTDGPRIKAWDPTLDRIDTLITMPRGNGLGLALHPDFPVVPQVFAVFDTSVYYGGG